MQYLGRARKNTTAADNTGTQDTVKKEEGSVVPLIAGLCALLLLIGSVTLAITGAHVQTQRLTDFADTQASAVARRLAKDQRAAAFNGVSLSPSQAQAYAAEYLAASGASREFSGLSIDSVDVSDGESVRIRLRGRIHPPLVSIVVPDGIEVSAHSSARLNTKQTN